MIAVAVGKGPVCVGVMVVVLVAVTCMLSDVCGLTTSGDVTGSDASAPRYRMKMMGETEEVAAHREGEADATLESDDTSCDSVTDANKSVQSDEEGEVMDEVEVK